MADITVDTDSSELTLTSGETISIAAGATLTVSTDLSATGVIISGNGALKLVDGGYLKITELLPSTIALSSDIRNPTGSYFGNASAVLECTQLGVLYSGMPHFRTVERFPGTTPWKARSVSISGNTVKLDGPITCIPGDVLYSDAGTPDGQACSIVDSYDPDNHIVTLRDRISSTYFGYGHPVFCVASAPLLIIHTAYTTGGVGIFNGGLDADEICVQATNCTSSDRYMAVASGAVRAKKISYIFSRTNNSRHLHLFVSWVASHVDKASACALISSHSLVGSIKIDELLCGFLCFEGSLIAKTHIKNALVASTANDAIVDLHLDGGDTPAVLTSYCPITSRFRVGNQITTNGGTATLVSVAGLPLGSAWYHSPATSANTSWIRTDYTVKRGETIHISARWLAAGASSVGRIAISDLEVFYPSLNNFALAEHVFDGGDTVNWASGLISWRNDCDETRTVRVWETCTGGNGYLAALRVTGGAL